MTKRTKKLSLKKETIKDLNALVEVKGGVLAYPSKDCQLVSARNIDKTDPLFR